MQPPPDDVMPWFSIWLKPRQTMRQISDTDPSQNIVILSILIGAAHALRHAADNNAADFVPLTVVALAVLATSVVIGPLSLYVGAAILHWVSTRFEGQASVVELRAAIVWSAVPLIVGLVLWPPLIALVGPELFSATKSSVEASPSLSSAVALFAIVQTILLVWSFVLQVLCLSQVTQLSTLYGIILSIVPVFIFRVLTSTAVVALLTLGA